MPGARKIPTETDCDHLQRAIKEVPFGISVDCITYLASTTLKAKRGVEYADIRGVIVPYDPEQAGFYDVDDLPYNIIEHHETMIKMVRGK